MSKEIDWQAHVKGILKAELKRHHATYGMLAEKLTELGIPETAENIANKISRGGFTAVFFIQCLQAVGSKTIHLTDAE